MAVSPLGKSSRKLNGPFRIHSQLLPKEPVDRLLTGIQGHLSCVHIRLKF
jgi:hypothetical protein